MKLFTALFIALITCSCNQSPMEKLAEDTFDEAKTQLMIRCQGHYELPMVKAAFRAAMELSPDSAVTYATALWLNSKIGFCPDSTWNGVDMRKKK